MKQIGTQVITHAIALQGGSEPNGETGLKRKVTNMKRLLLFGMIFIAVTTVPASAKPRRSIVFEATVVRVEPWGPVRISCGVAIVFRLAEYRIDKVIKGQLPPGPTLIVEHLACNNNELDDLKPGEKVTVVATVLPKLEKRSWMIYPTTLRATTLRITLRTAFKKFHFRKEIKSLYRSKPYR